MINDPTAKSKTSLTSHIQAHDHNFHWFWSTVEDRNQRASITDLWPLMKVELARDVRPKRMGTSKCTMCRIERSIIHKGLSRDELINANSDWLHRCTHLNGKLVNFVSALSGS